MIQIMYLLIFGDGIYFRGFKNNIAINIFKGPTSHMPLVLLGKCFQRIKCLTHTVGLYVIFQMITELF